MEFLKKYKKGIWIGVILYTIAYCSIFLVPCLLDSTECSGRDIAIYVLSMPSSHLLNFIAIDMHVYTEMFWVYVFGSVQYGMVCMGIQYAIKRLNKQ